MRLTLPKTKKMGTTWIIYIIWIRVDQWDHKIIQNQPTKPIALLAIFKKMKIILKISLESHYTIKITKMVSMDELWPVSKSNFELKLGQMLCFRNFVWVLQPADGDCAIPTKYYIGKSLHGKIRLWVKWKIQIFGTFSSCCLNEISKIWDFTLLYL